MTKLEQLRTRYNAALHAMQSGVAVLLEHDPAIDECTPKHLRVGVNAAMIDSAAVAKLLIDKGIFTEEEYAESLVFFAERDKQSYEDNLSALKGFPVKLA